MRRRRVRSFAGYPRSVRPRSGICCLCRQNVGALTYEHVPPRAAFNNERTRVYGLDDWLRRGEDGLLTGGRIEQRGAGDYTLCAECNNNSGSWYGSELRYATASAARLLREAPLVEFDAKPEPTWAEIGFLQSEAQPSPHPLRFIKHVVTMLLATSPPELSTTHPELGDFVREREAIGLPDTFQFYLALYAGPLARSTGIATRADFATGRIDTLVEVAFPPFAYVMAIDSEDDDAIATANITEFVTVGYNQTADIRMTLLIGFGHTPYPADYRTRAMVEEERRLDEQEQG